MPTTAPIDWELVQTLYIQGLPPKTITERTGAPNSSLRNRITRGNWRELRQNVARSLNQAAVATLDSLSSKVKNDIGQAISKHTALIPKATSWQKVKEINNDLEPLVRNAKVVFGWGDNEDNAVVRIGIMASTTIDVVPPEKSILIEGTTTPEKTP